MKQEFEMTQAEMDDIIAINKSQMPVLKIGSVTTGMDLQERINAYWEGLGDKYGFKHLTVEPSAKGALFFLAEPKPIVVPKTETQIAIDKYLGRTEGYVSYEVTTALRKIIAQLDGNNYECEGGFLRNNIAFLALKQLAGLPN